MNDAVEEESFVYLVHFPDRGTEMRTYGERLVVGSVIIDSGRTYRLSYVEHGEGPGVLGRVHALPASSR
jgi:hypothetical protein